MKSLLCGVLGVAGGGLLLAQGTVVFDNHVVASHVDWVIDAPFYDDRGIFLSGGGYVAQLYLWQFAGGFVPVGDPVPFSALGYFDGGILALPIPNGWLAWLQVRAWKADGGSSFEAAALAGAWTGVSSEVFVSTGDYTGNPPKLPAYLHGLQYPVAPLVVRAPQSQSVMVGARPTLSMIASSGVAMAYQWYQLPSDRPDGLLVGATNATYRTLPMSTNSTFWVTVSNVVGTVRSESVAVTVVSGSAPRLSVALSEGRPVLTVSGPVGTTLRIEQTEVLGSGDWIPWTDVHLSSGLATLIDTTAPSATTRFYQAVVK